jgi:3-hydroxybutyrate dehydrogenase
MMFREKVVLITGAANGIGRHIAAQFLLEGAKVCLADLDYKSAQAAAEQIGDAESTLAVSMDVTDERQVGAGIEAACERFGKIDVLISNAGIQHIAPIVDLSFQDWQRIVAVHLDGAFLTTRACMRKMIEKRCGGSIIYMGSVHSHIASPLKAPYVTVKHGLLGLARVVAKEGAGDGIRSNVVCPGFVRTALVDAQIRPLAAASGISAADVVSTMLQGSVDGEFTTVDDVARTTLFLAGFPTNALTGQSIVVSHGWHMN